MSLLNSYSERPPSSTAPPSAASRLPERPDRRTSTFSESIDTDNLQKNDSSENRLLDILDRIGCGYIKLENRRKVLEANAAARRLLIREEDAIDTLDGLTSAFKRLIGRAQTPLTASALSWVAISGRGDPPVILNRSADDGAHGVSSVILLDLDAHLAPNPLTLQKMFGLTMAETRLALQMARGDAPAEIARSRCSEIARTACLIRPADFRDDPIARAAAPL